MNEEVLAYFLTWTCYGTYLPGDARGWTRWRKGDQTPEPRLEDWTHERLSEYAVRLDSMQRELVVSVVNEHCKHRGWTLHAINCRSNHCHAVVTAPQYRGIEVRDQLKSWTTRRLKSQQADTRLKSNSMRTRWWTRKGSIRLLFDEAAVAAAVAYTLEAQDRGGSMTNRSASS